MNEAETQIEAPAKRKTIRKKAKPHTAAPKGSPFAGLTKTDCAKGCNAERCVVSGKPYCAHPAKGGLQSSDLGNRESAERLQQAVKYLKRQAAA